MNIVKFIPVITVVISILTIMVTIIKNSFDKVVELNRLKIINGYLPLYEYFYRFECNERFEKKFHGSIYINASEDQSLKYILDKLDKSLLSINLAKLIIEYNFNYESFENYVTLFFSYYDYDEDDDLKEVFADYFERNKQDVWYIEEWHQMEDCKEIDIGLCEVEEDWDADKILFYFGSAKTHYDETLVIVGKIRKEVYKFIEKYTKKCDVEALLNKLTINLKKN